MMHITSTYDKALGTPIATGDATQAMLHRLDRLEAIEAIRALKAHYSALADAKYTPAYTKVSPDDTARVAAAQAACFTTDAVWAGGAGFGGDLIGREAINTWFMRSPWRFAMHYYVSVSLTVDCAQNQAEAYWRLCQIALPDQSDNEARPVWLGAVTHERYRRDAPGAPWLISYMNFTDIHLLELSERPLSLARSLADLAALRQRAL